MSTASTNPILEYVLELAGEGLHPRLVAVERVDGHWRCRVEFDDWCALGDGGESESPYAVAVDRDNLPDGVSVRGRERFSPRCLALELPTREEIESWIRGVAVAGGSPDMAWIGDRCLTKPIEWLREPLRSALKTRADK